MDFNINDKFWDGMVKQQRNHLSLDSGDLENSPLVEWFMQNGEKILYSILGLFLALFIFFMWSSGTSSKSIEQYRDAYDEFQVFKRPIKSTEELAVQNEALSKLSYILKEHPELQAKYDGDIAQILISRDAPLQAIPYAESTFKRVGQDHLPLYSDYSKITLLIEQNKYKEALERSLLLKEQILKSFSANKQESSVGGALYAFNLLRIASIQGKIGMPNEEIQTWREWKKETDPQTSLAARSGFDAKDFFMAAQLFNEGSLSLNDYIDERINYLQK